VRPDAASIVLTALTIGGAWFATWLARRGKREDNKLQSAAQTFTELQQLAEERLTEIKYGTDAAISGRNESEKRSARQKDRCRKVTDEAAASILRLMPDASPQARSDAELTLRDIQDHIDTDHPSEEGGR
jgi:hypothetical protein